MSEERRLIDTSGVGGELAIMVDAPWRGSLGPYLLDALIELAAAHGVPNLEADAGQTEVAETELRVGSEVDLIGVVEAMATAHARRSVGVDDGDDQHHPVSGASA